jgi:activator of HSP90 ATPase
MNERKNQGTSVTTPTRRKVISGIAAALGTLAATRDIWGKAPQGMNEPPTKGTDRLRTSLHQEIELSANPHRIYAALLDSRQFAAFSGAPATIDPGAGGAFSMFAGQITGRNVELVPDFRIVQAWRPSSWAPGLYSIVKFELKEHGSQTLVVLDHTGFPEGKFAGLDSGWHQHYWEPLEKYFASRG